MYATLLREECSICVVTLHGIPAETWLVACEAALLQGSVHKMEKSSSFISLVKTKLEISFHFPSLLEEVGGIYFIAGALHKTSCAGEDLAKGILDCQC